MNATTTFQYPFFASGQVLRSQDLNNLVTYLDQQNRLTRTLLIGSGIYYGMELSWQNNTLGIERGVGVTSEGFLFHIEAEQFTHATQVFIDIREFKCDREKPEVPEMLTLWELKKSNGANVALSEDFLADKVVMLFWESEQILRDSCFNECDEGGADVNVHLRRLLITIEDALRITKLIADETVINVLPQPFIRRYGHRIDSETGLHGIRLKEITSFEQFVSSWVQICEEAIPLLADSYVQANTVFGPILEIEGDFSSMEAYLFGLLEQVQEDPDIYCIQYLYDYLKDLILAYDELVCIDVLRGVANYPDECRFPYHLLLGQPVDEVGLVDQFRTDFIAPPIANLQGSDFMKARLMFERMIQLTSQSNLVLSQVLKDSLRQAIKITPSKSKLSPLSERAIPYYYQVPTLRNFWNYELRKLGKSPSIPSYIPGEGAGAPFDEHLLYFYETFEFLRVEGHVRKAIVYVLQELERERERLNVSFAIRLLKVGVIEDPSEFNGEVDFGDLERLYDKTKCDLERILDQLRDYVTDEIRQKIDELKVVINVKSLTLFNTARFQSLYNDVFDASLAGEREIEIPEDCSDKVILKIIAELQDRIKEFQELQCFHLYACKHPGLEHLAGVWNGGTLILPYIERPSAFSVQLDIFIAQIKRFNPQFDGEEFRKRFSRDQLYDRIVIGDFCLPYICCAGEPTITYEISERAEPVAKFAEITRIPIYDDDCIYIGQRITFENQSQRANRFDWLVDGRPEFADIINKEPFIHDFIFSEKATYQVKLIAHYTGLFAEEEQTIAICPPQVVFMPFEQTSFLKGASGNQFSFGVQPTGGAFSVADQDGNEISNLITPIRGEGEIPCENIQYRFNYSKLPQGTYNIFYRIPGCPSSSSQTITIVEPPVAGFSEKERIPRYTVEGCDLEGYDITFENQSTNAKSYQWFVNGVSREITNQLKDFTTVFLFSQGPSFNVKLIATNSGLNDESAEEVMICPGSVSVDLAQTTLTKGTNNRVDIQVSLPGGVFTLINPDGNEVSAPTRKVFSESGECIDLEYQLDFAKLAGGSYQLIYRFPKCPAAPPVDFQVVEELPEARLVQLPSQPIEGDCLLTGFNIAFENRSTNANNYKWLVNDETILETTNRNNFVHEFRFEKGTNYTVALSASSSSGSDTAQVSFSVCPEVQIQLKDTILTKAPTNQSIDFQALPMGGSFDLVGPEGESIPPPIEPMLDVDSCADARYRLTFIELPAGTYTLAYGFADCDRTTTQFIVEDFQGEVVVDGPIDIDGGTGDVVAIAPEAGALLNQRLNDERKVMEEMGTDASLKKTKGYQLADLFLTLPANSPNVNVRFEEAAQQLIENYKRSIGKPRAEQYRQMLEVLLHNYLDKQVATNPKALSDESQQLLINTVQKMKEVDLDVAPLHKSWNSKELKDALDAPAVDEVTKLFK